MRVESKAVGVEAETERRLARMLCQIGDSSSIRRFLSGYGKLAKVPL